MHQHPLILESEGVIKTSRADLPLRGYGRTVPKVGDPLVQLSVVVAVIIVCHFGATLLLSSLLLLPGGNCIKIGLPGKSILKAYFQENRTFLLLRISFPGRPILQAC